MVAGVVRHREVRQSLRQQFVRTTDHNVHPLEVTLLAITPREAERLANTRNHHPDRGQVVQVLNRGSTI